MEEDAGVVGPLRAVELGAVDGRVGAVVEVVLGVDQAEVLDPVPRLLGLLGVRLVPRVPGQARRDVEEAALGNRVLVRITGVEAVNLPAQAAAARRRVPAQVLRRVHGLRQREPTGLPFRRIRELALRGRHGRHAPEALVVVSERFRLVGRHVVGVVADLVDHALLHPLVVLVVARVVPVVDEGAEHGAALPPVVGIRQVSGHVAHPVSVVPVRHALGDGLHCRLDGIWGFLVSLFRLIETNVGPTCTCPVDIDGMCSR